jgi:hypothetical protein
MLVNSQWSCVMRHQPSIAPALPDDVDVYLVLDDFGQRLGRAWREADEERTDREVVIRDLLEGQYSDPTRVVAFNTGGGWSLDVSEEIAAALALHIALEDRETPPRLQSFLDRHCAGRPAQLQLPLRNAA